MFLPLVLATAGIGCFALVCVIRAVSCARFARALRSSGAVDDQGATTMFLVPEARSTVVDARHRFAARADDTVAVGRSVTPADQSMAAR